MPNEHKVENCIDDDTDQPIVCCTQQLSVPFCPDLSGHDNVRAWILAFSSWPHWCAYLLLVRSSICVQSPAGKESSSPWRFSPQQLLGSRQPQPQLYTDDLSLSLGGSHNTWPSPARYNPTRHMPILLQTCDTVPIRQDAPDTVNLGHIVDVQQRFSPAVTQ